MNSRLAVSLTFFTNGAFFACVACRLPDIQRHLGLDEGQLGLALLSASIGAFVGVATSGVICARNGSDRVMVGVGLAACALFPLLGLAPNLWAFVPLFFCFGACTATMDMAMNTNGVAVEKAAGKPIMSSLHGMFSLGALSFACVGWLVVKLGASVPVHFLGASALFACLLLGVVSPRMLRDSVAPGAVRPPFVLPERAVLAVGMIAFCAFLSEGAMGDWSAVYLRNALHQSPAASTFGYLAFTLSMTAMRFWGDWVLLRWGPSLTLRVSGLVTTVGMGSALWVGIPWLTVVGFASVGLGMATVAPVAFSVGGRLGGENPGHAISSIATMSYTAFLIGPALIGFLAKSFSLRDALAVVVVLALGIVALSGFASEA